MLRPRPDVDRPPSARAVFGVAGIALAVALAVAAACGGGVAMDDPDDPDASADAPSAVQAPVDSSPAAPSAGAPPGDAPLGPLTSRGEPAAAAPEVPPLASAGGSGFAGVAGRLVWALPAGWTEVPPANPMRMAQASIPGAGGPAELVLFHFGAGGGGTVEDNLARWIGQVEAEGEPARGVFAAGSPGEGGVRVSWVDVAGTLKPSGMGMGPTEPQPGSRLLGAVVEGAGGPWFFKATGPAETLAAARADFLAMLRAARIE